MNVQILGWYDNGNIGDEAYKAAFPLLFPDHELKFVNEVTLTEGVDAVILGGGDVCYPAFTNNFSWVDESTRKLVASVTLTERSDFTTLKGLEKVYVRDHRSLRIGRNKGIDCEYLPDATFTLTGDGVRGREWLTKRFEEQGHELYDKVVVCVVSNYMSYSKLNQLSRDLTNFMYFSQQVAQSADNTDASFVFLPFSTKTPWDDRVSNAWVADRCKHYIKNTVIYDVLDPQTTLDIVASANVCVSGRLHSTIFSTICGVPFIDITHHDKNLGFIETVGKTPWSIPYWEFSIRQYNDLMNDFLTREQKDESLLAYSQISKENLRAATIL